MDYFYNLFSRRKNKSSLSYLIEKRRKELKLRRKIFIPLYIPSYISLISMLAFFIISFLISHFVPLPFISEDNNIYQKFILIHTGISFVIFALIIFIAESLRDGETRDRAKVLLKETLLFPLVGIEILTFFIFLWGGVNLLILIPIATIGIFIIRAIWKIIKVLLNNSFFLEKRIELYKNQIEQKIHLEIDERLGKNILNEKLNSREIKLIYHPFFNEDDTKFYSFTTEKTGTIKDINLAKLKEFADELEKEVNLIGSVLEEGNIKKQSSIENIAENKARELPDDSRRYITKNYQDKVTKESNAVFLIDKKFIKNPEVFGKLESIAKKIFIIEEKDEDFSKGINAELASIKDQFILSIINKKISIAEELSELYIELTKAFLDSIKIPYSFENARKEIGSLLGGWDEIKWLSSDIKDIFEEAINANNQNFIEIVISLPFNIVRASIDRADNYLFQKFLPFITLLYWYSFRVDKDYLKDFMIDRSWRTLKELADFYVEPKMLKNNLQPEEISNLKNYAIFFFLMFQNLLKSAFEKNDLANFSIFIDKYYKIFERFEPSKRFNSKHIRLGINIIKDLNKKEEARASLEYALMLENVEEEIFQRRHQMIFGLASFLLEEFINKKEDYEILEFFKTANKSILIDLKELTKIFLSSYSFEAEEFWGWDLWYLKKEGEAEWIDIKGKLIKYYCVKSLQILSRTSTIEINELKLESNRDFANLIGENNEIGKILNEIKNNKEFFSRILSEADFSKIDLFKKILLEAKTKQLEIDSNEKRIQNISLQKVKEFKLELINSFFDAAKIRDIYSYYNRYSIDFNKGFNQKKERFGINTLEDKGAFIEDWHIKFFKWGTHYGESLASGEDSFLIDKIISKSINVNDYDWGEIFKKFKNLSNIIIFVINFDFYDLGDKNYKPAWLANDIISEISAYDGKYFFQDLKIPVYQIFTDNNKKFLIFLDKSQMGKVEQFSPLDEKESSPLQEDIFYTDIQSLSENSILLNNFLDSPPKWLKEMGTIEEQKKYLEERVLIKIFERFDFSINDFKGYYYEFDEKDFAEQLKRFWDKKFFKS